MGTKLGNGVGTFLASVVFARKYYIFSPLPFPPSPFRLGTYLQGAIVEISNRCSIFLILLNFSSRAAMGGLAV